ncbi:MAG TPA: adenylosuccinate lyase family protein [Pyrinomonadaceae bacterium]|nr:adenylosuccinate lyase family protein [Pyrinomonadaceae bacterium]
MPKRAFGNAALIEDHEEKAKMRNLCPHDSSSIVDSRFYGHLFSTPASKRIFCDVCRLQRWLDVEAALSRVQARVGLISEQAAIDIADCAQVEKFNLKSISEHINTTGHSLTPVLNALASLCPGDSGNFVHFGATTQDIQDTAQSLELRDVLDEIHQLGWQILEKLEQLTIEYRDCVVVGRTHSVPALPTTFGLKVAGWIDEILRDLVRIEEMRKRVLVVQLFGGVGTMAAFGEHGLELIELFAQELGLGVPVNCWHSSRDRVAEFISGLAIFTCSLARVADEIRTLCRSEIGELQLPWPEGHIGSTTMPHKRNPEECEQVVALARLARAQVSLGMEAMIQEHERDYRCTRVEWPAIANVSHFSISAASILLGVLSGLSVRSEAMGSNVKGVSGWLCSERLLFALAKRLGKIEAYKLVYEVSRSAVESGRGLEEVARSNGLVRKHLGLEEIDDAFDFRRHLGSGRELTGRVLAALDDTRDLMKVDRSVPKDVSNAHMETS